jgi:hypothetical protein
MAFDRTYFSSVNNQQCSGERIQTWQYESVDPLSDLTAGGYFDPVRQSLQVNDSIWVVSMDPTRTVAQSRSNLTVRVNGEANGTNQSALVVLPELADTAMTVLEFSDLTTAQTPAAYGTELTLTAGAADTDLAYSVTVTPTSVPAGSGTLRVFIQTKLA